MKGLYKIFTVFALLVCMTVSAMAQGHVDADGNIIINMHEGATSVAGSGAYASDPEWQIFDDASSPTGHYIEVGGDRLEDNTKNPSGADYGASMHYTFNLDEVQSYYVWMLVNAPSKDDGRLFVGVNGKCIDKRKDTEFAEIRPRVDFGDNWQWIRVGNNLKDILQTGNNTLEIYKFRPDIKVAQVALADAELNNMILDQPAEVKVTSNTADQMTISWSEASVTGQVMQLDNNTALAFTPAYRITLDGEVLTGGDVTSSTVDSKEYQEFENPYSENSYSFDKSVLGSDKHTLTIELAHPNRVSSSKLYMTYSNVASYEFDVNTPAEDGGETPEVPDTGDDQTDIPHEADANGVYMFQASEFFENKAAAADGEMWKVGTDATFGKYMYLENTDSDNRNETSSARYDSPSLVYQIQMAEAKTGFVWALVNEGAKDAGRVWVNMNDLDLDKRAPGEYGSTAAKSRISDDVKGQWQWILLNNQANSSVVKDGVNVIELFKARPNIKIAKIAFTPTQSINLIINQVTPRVTANDGTNVTIGWDEPGLTAELYDFNENIFTDKSFFYQVTMGGEVLNDSIPVNRIQIPVSDLETPQEISVEAGHMFRKNSSSDMNTYSLPTTITVDKNSQPGGDEDNEAPTQPTDLASSDITATSVKLTWTASTDNVGVVGYIITQDGADLSTKASENEITVTGLAAETEYTFAVRAYDAAGNESEKSAEIKVTTAEGGENPGGGTGIIINPDDDLIYSWNATDFDMNNAGTGAFEGEKWLVGADDEVGRYIYLANTDTTTNANKVSADRAESPSVTYNLSNVDASSSRYIWALIQQGATNSGKVYADLNGICSDARAEGSYGAAFGSRVSAESVGKWQWVQIGYNVQKIAKDGQLNTIEIFKAYPDIKIAKLMFTRTQDYVPIINKPRAFVQENDGESVTVAWDEAVLQYLLYDHDMNLFGEGHNDPNFTYKVRVEGQDEVTISEPFIKIPYSHLASPKTVTVSIGHLFRKGSSKTEVCFSLPTRLAGVSTESQPDFDAPTVPQDLQAIDIQGTNVALSWTASTDNVGVLGYNLYLDGILLQTMNATSYKVSGLSTSTKYTFEVTAFDAAGNESDRSEALEVTTRDKDDEVTDRPSKVEDLNATSVTTTSFTLNWRPSNSLNGITGYYVYIRRAGETDFQYIADLNGETFSYALTNLYAGTTYELKVVAEDGMGYLSEDSEILSVTTTSNPLSNDGLLNKKLIKAYPNPAMGAMKVVFNGQAPFSYQVISITGAVQKQTTTHDSSVSLEMPSGLYILKAIDANGQSEAQRVVFQ